jgi:hypothetical protein
MLDVGQQNERKKKYRNEENKGRWIEREKQWRVKKTTKWINNGCGKLLGMVITVSKWFEGFRTIRVLITSPGCVNHTRTSISVLETSPETIKDGSGNGGGGKEESTAAGPSLTNMSGAIRKRESTRRNGRWSTI